MKFFEIIKNNLFGQKILKELEISEKISFNKILYWIYYLNKFFLFIKILLGNFKEVCCIDYSDNNFIISIKKDRNKSIGFLYTLI